MMFVVVVDDQSGSSFLCRDPIKQESMEPEAKYIFFKCQNILSCL
jgi:hypothetical protein